MHFFRITNDRPASGVPMDLDLNCVEAFLVLAGQFHFAKAAGVLHVTPSALSKRIRKLEIQLGVQLVERGPSGFVALTNPGKRFAPHAQNLLEEANAARVAVRRPPNPTAYRLGLPGQLADHPERVRLPALAQALRREMPGAKLRCFGIPFPLVVTALLGGLIDVMWDVSSGNHPDIESVPLRSFERIGVIPTEHPFADADEIPVNQFADEPMIYDVGVPAAWMATFYLDDIRSVNDAHLIEMHGSNSTDVKDTLLLKTGVTVAPTFMARDLGPHLASVKLTGVPLTPSFASHRRNDDRETVMRLILELQILTAGE